MQNPASVCKYRVFLFTVVYALYKSAAWHGCSKWSSAPHRSSGWCLLLFASLQLVLHLPMSRLVTLTFVTAVFWAETPDRPVQPSEVTAPVNGPSQMQLCWIKNVSLHVWQAMLDPSCLHWLLFAEYMHNWTATRTAYTGTRRRWHHVKAKVLSPFLRYLFFIYLCSLSATSLFSLCLGLNPPLIGRGFAELTSQ